VIGQVRNLIPSQVRNLIPSEVRLPCERSAAVIAIRIVVDGDRVTAPTLDELKGVLALGSADLVRSYCQIWTRWLARESGGKL